MTETKTKVRTYAGVKTTAEVNKWPFPIQQTVKAKSTTVAPPKVKPTKSKAKTLAQQLLEED